MEEITSQFSFLVDWPPASSRCGGIIIPKSLEAKSAIVTPQFKKGKISASMEQVFALKKLAKARS